MTPLSGSLVWGVLLWGTSTAHAADLALPASEDRAAWHDALVVSGLATVPGTARLEPGPTWTLVVTRADGTTARRSIAPPTTPDARESAAILAASLLRPVATTTLPLALPPLPAAPEPEPPPPKPAPRPAPKPPPPPKPEPSPLDIAPEPVAVAPEPTVRSLHVAVAVGGMSRVTPDQGTGLGTLGSCTVQAETPWLVEIGAGWAWTPRIEPDNPDRDLVAATVWSSVGWHVRPPIPAVTLSLGGMGRRYRFEETTIAAVDIPWVGVGVLWDPPFISGTRGGLRLTARAERDLRRTILADASGAEGAVSPVGLTVGIAGRWGPALGTWDTASGLPPARREKSSSP